MTHRPLTLCVTAVALLAACEDDRLDDPYYGPMVYDVFPDTARGASQDPSDPESLYRMFQLKAGYVNGEIAEYADFGPLNPILPDVYVMVHDGKPVEGQYPIVDVAPDKPEYSSFWHVVEVEVPSNYVANSIKSLAGIKRNDYPLVPTQKATYCPIVNPDALFVTYDEAGTYTVFYGTGEPVPNPYFAGPDDAGTPATVTDTEATEGDVRLTPLWHKRLLGFCLPGVLDTQRSKSYGAIRLKDDSTCLETGEGASLLASCAMADADPQICDGLQSTLTTSGCATRPEGERGACLASQVEVVECARHWELLPSSFGARYSFYQPVDPMVGEYVEWGLPPIFGAAPADDASSPAVIDFALFTDMPTELASLDGLDLTAAEGLQYLDNLIFRTIPIPEPAPEEGDAAAMQ